MKDLKEQAKEYRESSEFPHISSLIGKGSHKSIDSLMESFANQVTEQLKDKLSISIRCAEEARKGRERMRKLYAEKLEENTKLKEGVKKYLDWMYDEDLIKLKELLNENKANDRSSR